MKEEMGGARSTHKTAKMFTYFSCKTGSPIHTILLKCVSNKHDLKMWPEIWGPEGGFCESGNQVLGFTNEVEGEGFFDQLTYCHLFKNNSAPRSYAVKCIPQLISHSNGVYVPVRVRSL
jgi:hypothetical protein